MKKRKIKVRFLRHGNSDNIQINYSISYYQTFQSYRTNNYTLACRLIDILNYCNIDFQDFIDYFNDNTLIKNKKYRITTHLLDDIIYLKFNLSTFIKQNRLKLEDIQKCLIENI